MSEAIRVLGLRAEDFLRLKVVEVHPNPTGITRVVGRNGQGKTSLLNALAAALGGASHTPEQPIRKGASKAEVVVDLGSLTVKKVWRQGSVVLEVRDKDNVKVSSPQALLDRLVGELAFDPLAFSRLKPADQAAVLAKMAGIDLTKMAADRKKLYDQRRDVGRQRDTAAAAIRNYPAVEAPAEEVSVTDLMAELEKAEAVNRKADARVQAHKKAVAAEATAKANLERATAEVLRLRAALKAAEDDEMTADNAEADARQATADALADLQDAVRVDLTPIRERIAQSDDVNRKVRQNKDRAKAEALAKRLNAECDTISQAMQRLDDDRDRAVAEANLPIPGLGLWDEGAVFNGVPFEQASQAEQLQASVAIGLALNPRLKLMIVRDGSLLDADSMVLLAEMAEKAGAQVLVERVGTTGETGIVIEDGEVVEEEGGE